MSVFWDDHNRDMQSPEYAEAFEAAAERILIVDEFFAGLDKIDDPE